MKRSAIWSLLLSTLFTLPALADNSLSSSVVAPTDAGATSEMQIEAPPTNPLGQLNPRIVPQLGMSSMQYSNGGNSGQGFAGGVTTELGSTKMRLFETGLLYFESNGQANVGPNGTSRTITTSQLAIPMMAKIRFIDTPSQAWYFKFGGTTTFQTATNYNQSNAFDVLLGGGVGARLPVNRNIDMLVEATFNRGMLAANPTNSGEMEGLLFFTGLSFGI